MPSGVLVSKILNFFANYKYFAKNQTKELTLKISYDSIKIPKDINVLL